MAISTHALVESVANYCLVVTGGHVSQQVLYKIDRSEINVAARKVVGASISAKREILYALAGVRTTHNHYLVKTANMLDRVLRAPNAAAETSAWAFINTLRTQLDGRVIEATISKWQMLGPPTDYRTEGKQVDYESKTGESGKAWTLKDCHWEINTGGWTSIKRSQAQTIIYQANMDAEATLIKTPQLLFNRTKGRNAYELAVTILQCIGWYPSLAFDQSIYPLGYERINWAKMYWGEETEQTRQEHNTHAKSIHVISEPLKRPRHNIATTRIDISGKQKRTRAHILGTKLIPRPNSLEGAILTISLKEVRKNLPHQQESKEDHEKCSWHIIMCAGCLNNLSLHNKLRWKQYGTPDEPLPEQEGPNSLLAKLADRPEIKDIEMRRVPKTTHVISKSIARKIWRTSRK